MVRAREMSWEITEPLSGLSQGRKGGFTTGKGKVTGIR